MDALAVVESTRRSIAGDQFRTGFFATKRSYYDLEIDLLMRLGRHRPDSDYRTRALEASERARARGLLDLLAEGRIDIRQGLDQDLRQREIDLSDQLSRVQRELRAGSAMPEKLQDLQAERDALDGQLEQLEVEIQTKNKRYAEVRYPNPLKLEQIQHAILDDKTALLEYVLGEKLSYLFLITRGEIRTYDLPAAGEIGKQVLKLREALEQESLLKRRDYLDSAHQLYQDLLEPAATALTGKSNLLVVPDGALYYIPFEALLTAPNDRPYKDLPYLVRLYSIAYVPSASVLAGLREQRRDALPAERKQLVGFAPFASAGSGAATRGPAHRSSIELAASRWNFKPLPASGVEISKIAGLYPGEALSFVGSGADEATVTGNPAVATARRLHFATHALIDERRPEYSALVLAERPGEDGLLQMREIFNLKLSADLAVLSACETARGKEVTGEGLVGLTRAFFYAGVSSLVVSLWNVVDGPTPDLMLDFYRQLDRLQNKAAALQASKLSMIDRGAFAHPSYWAPFILVGEPR
jgi:CHAT domain-containing protein